MMILPAKRHRMLSCDSLKTYYWDKQGITHQRRFKTFIGVQITGHWFFMMDNAPPLILPDTLMDSGKDIDGNDVSEEDQRYCFSVLPPELRKHCRTMSSTAYTNIRTYKAFRRHCKKVFSLLPKGTEVTLTSRFSDFEITYIV